MRFLEALRKIAHVLESIGRQIHNICNFSLSLNVTEDKNDANQATTAEDEVKAAMKTTIKVSGYNARFRVCCIPLFLATPWIPNPAKKLLHYFSKRV